MFNDFIVLKYNNILDDEGQMYLERMQAACERMQSLINDIDTLSKIDFTKSAVVHSDMNLLLKDVLSNMDVIIKKKNAVITIDSLPHLNVYPDLIKLMFQHLISNSIKFSHEDIDPVIRITANMELPDGSPEKMNINKYWRIYIHDNGVGFEQQYAEQIFTLFKRLHGNSEYAGTGVGLSICKKIAEEHQGYISAKSIVNKGTVFTISFPIDNPETEKRPS